MVQPWNLGPPAVDFSSIANLGRNFVQGYETGRKMEARSRLSDVLSGENPDYRKAAAAAIDMDDSGSALALLGMGQKEREAQLARQADAEAGGALAAFYGGGSAMSRLTGGSSTGGGANGAGRPFGQPPPSAPRLADLGGGDAPPPSGTATGAPAGLTTSESGDRWDAQNSAVGAGGLVGHFGRIQFGQARLQDAMNAGAIPQGTTPEQFMNSPDLQKAAERWHWADIESGIRQNGFDRMIGQSIGGTPITMNGMKAVAHLGGTEGLRKFVETGGQYNPADVNGTRLSDYFSRMAGGAAAPVVGAPPESASSQYPSMRPSVDIQDDPNVPNNGPGVPLAYRGQPAAAGTSRADQDYAATGGDSPTVPTAPAAPSGQPQQRTLGGPDYVPPGFDQFASKQHIGALSTLMAKPYLTAGMREVVKMHLAAALNNAEKIPENVKTYLWARANGETGGLGFKAFTEKSGRDSDPGAKIKAEAAARREEADRLGLREGAPERTRYIAEGKIGSDEKPDRKAIGDADAAITSAQEALGSIREAKALSSKAYEGPTAGLRGAVMANIGNEAGVATMNLNNVIQTSALAQMKSIFGSNPTEGERKIQLEVAGSANLPRAVRDAVFDRAEAAIQRRLTVAMNKAAELREGSYYKPGGGMGGRGAAPQANAGQSVAPAQAADFLRANPALRDQFDAKYGAGAAAQVLGQ